MTAIQGTIDAGTEWARDVEYLLECDHSGRVESSPFDLSRDFGLDPSTRALYKIYELTEMREGFRVTNAQRIFMLWLPELQRGAVTSGSDPIWSDAENPEDLAQRILITGEIAA